MSSNYKKQHHSRVMKKLITLQKWHLWQLLLFTYSVFFFYSENTILCVKVFIKDFESEFPIFDANVAINWLPDSDHKN
jgi:hypothetical protein